MRRLVFSRRFMPSRSAAPKIVTSIIAVLLLVAAVVFAAWDSPAKTGQYNYSIAQIGRGDIVRAVMTTGQLSPLVSVEVSTQISGLITEVAVDFNSPVKKGQLLARIDPSTYQQKVNQAK